MVLGGGARGVRDNSLRARRRPKAAQKAAHELMSCEQRGRSEGQSGEGQGDGGAETRGPRRPPLCVELTNSGLLRCFKAG